MITEHTAQTNREGDMETEKRDSARAAMVVADEQNPAYIFSQTDNTLLLKITQGTLDPVLAAKQELLNRGIGYQGEWIGFDAAKKFWNA